MSTVLHRLLCCFVLLPVALGCRPVDAPDSLEDLVVYGFRHHGADAAHLEATHAELVPLVDDNAEALAEGLRVGELGAEELDAAGVPDAEVTGILGAMGAVSYAHDLDAVLAIVTHEHKDELFDNTITYEVLESTDRDCFLARTCDALTQRVVETSDAGLLGTATRTFTAELRWITPDDGAPVVYMRQTCPDPVAITSTLVKIHQQYALVALYDDGDTARRVEAFWVDAEFIGMDVPDSYAVDSAVDRMAEQAADVDAVIDGL